MNDAMTPEELLKAENTFIRLYNQGVSVEDIADRLELELKTIKGWQKNLEEAIESQRNHYPKNLDISIQEKGNNGSYLYYYSFNYTDSGLDKLKRELSFLSNNPTDNLSNDLALQAKRHLEFVTINLESFDYKIDEQAHISFNYKFKSGADTLENIEEAEKLYKFYYTYAVQFEQFSKNSELILDKTQEKFSSFKNILSYSIKTIVIQGFQGINLCEIKEIPTDTPWLFLSGNNGYGKSTFLRAIAVGLIGHEENAYILTDDLNAKIGIEYKSQSTTRINNLWARGLQPLDHLACYGPSRLQIQAKMAQNEVAEKSSTTYGLFNPDGILLNIESKLIEWYLEKNERLEQVKTLFKDVIPYLTDIVVRKNEQDDYEVLYVERVEEDETVTFDPVPFDKLAAGFRSVIGLIGDLLIRFIRKQPYVKQLSELAGIVLIDELENHLHPKWQYQLPTLLSKAFPNIQFIASTHSVIPILGAPKNSVFLKLNRSKEKGITVERINIDLANLLPNSILTSPIFDMDTIRPIANEDVGQLRTEDTYDEVIANNEIDKQLRELDNDPSQYPALLQE